MDRCFLWCGSKIDGRIQYYVKKFVAEIDP